MKKMLYKIQQGFIGILSVALLLSCHQVETFEMEENGPVYFSTGVSSADAPSDCTENCIDLSADEVVYFPIADMKSGSSGPNTKEVSYVAYNTESEFVVEVTYEIVSGNSNAKADITVTIDGNEELFEEVASGSTVTHSIPLPDGWEACDMIDFSVTQEALGTNIVFVESYSLIGVCEECEFRSATAYVGDMPGGNSGTPGNGFNNAWWFVFDLEGDAEQTIYANQDEEIGTATYDEVEGTITFDLGDWSLIEEEDNSVKWYSYPDGALHEDGRPTPGLAPNKGNGLVIDVNDDRYYAIHLDVEICE